MKIIIREAVSETAKLSFNNQSFEVTSQEAIFESDDGDTRQKFRLKLKSGAKPYPVGEYKVGDGSFQFDGKKKEFVLARELELVPVKVAGALQSPKAA